MAHVAKDKQRLLARVRKLAGQVGALQRSLKGEPECRDVLMQIAAIKGAANGLMGEILSGHLQEHVVNEDDARRRAREAKTVVDLILGYSK